MFTTNRKILVIDDEKAIQEVVQLSLEMAQGWQVLTASSGSEGLQSAEREQPDAVLLDMSMAGMDGIATFHKFRQNSITQTIPVILLTAHAHPSVSHQAIALGLAGVILKPFDPIHLAEEVVKILGW